MYGDALIGGMSAYAIRSKSTKKRTVFNFNKKVQPGEIDIPDELRTWATTELAGRRLVMVNPHIKTRATCAAKDWGWQNWLKLVQLYPSGYFLQCDYGMTILPRVVSIKTPTFMHACALLDQCRGIVTIEGGMHHAAGALRQKAVVIMGGTNPPRVMGYDFHRNLAVNDPEALGWRCEHPAARRAMNRITVEMVDKAIRKEFK